MGGDRSLDRKYIDHQPDKRAQRMFYIWDVYMLLITAIFFVGLAEAIPKAGTTPASIPAASELAYFYYLMAALFLFDAVVLWIDFLKSDADRKIKLEGSYQKWIPGNLGFSIFCACAAYLIDPVGRLAPTLGLTSIAPMPVVVVVFCVAAARTFADYWFSDDFMFP
jgi:hypothetical protein